MVPARAARTLCHQLLLGQWRLMRKSDQLTVGGGGEAVAQAVEPGLLSGEKTPALGFEDSIYFNYYESGHRQRGFLRPDKNLIFKHLY